LIGVFFCDAADQVVTGIVKGLNVSGTPNLPERYGFSGTFNSDASFTALNGLQAK
jgi:hypothetical protein